MNLTPPPPNPEKAQSPDANTRAIFLLAHPSGDAVYCNPFYAHAGHGSVFAVDPATGALAACLQTYAYRPDAGVHGMAWDPAGVFLYSADMGANRLWVHRRRRQDGRPGHPASAADSLPQVDLVGSVEAPDARDKPRWVAVHPSGRFLYALMEKGNRICEFVVDPASRLPVYTHKHFPLIPPGVPDRWTQYRADVCAVSHSGRYLFASSRANNFSLTGYVAAFRLSDQGAIERQICLNPTPTSGGHSNAVAPCPWTDEWLAITDDEQGWLEIYRWQDEFLARVARVQVSEPGFGMNAIWYD